MLIILKKIFELLPNDTPEFIYKKISKFKPILYFVNLIILSIIPEKISLPSGRILLLNKKDPVISCALALGVYEKFEMSIFQDELRPGMTVVDIGANIGYYTIVAADRIGSTGEVICFEPDLESIEILQNNIEINKFKNIKCINKGLSNKDGVARFYSSSGNRGINSLRDFGDKCTYTEIETTTLDKTLPTNTKIDIIKMDIEGAEALALDGMGQSILRSDSLIIFTEFSPYRIKKFDKSPDEFLQKIMNFGFDLYNINSSKEKLERIVDINKFSQQYRKDKFTNIVGYKKTKI